VTAVTPRIAVQGLRKVFNPGSPQELVALRDVAFAVAPGEFVCLLGPSGCGKSTVLNIVAGLEPAAGGEVLLDGVPLGRDGGRPRPVGYVFQEPRLLPWLTVERNVHFALDCQRVPREAWPERTGRVLALVGLADFARHHAHQLSGGMQQRASIARALAIAPEVLLMDEPFSSLDEFTARDLRQQLLRIWAETGTTILFVTHNSFEATFLADRILLMSRRPGRIVDEVPIALPRPRRYDDPEVFETNRMVLGRFFKGVGEE
jgi:ABC-type nitrate/sulfonate/bicarbonate transport system ATPase subunit